MRTAPRQRRSVKQSERARWPLEQDWGRPGRAEEQKQRQMPSLRTCSPSSTRLVAGEREVSWADQPGLTATATLGIPVPDSDKVRRAGDRSNAIVLGTTHLSSVRELEDNHRNSPPLSNSAPHSTPRPQTRSTDHAGTKAASGGETSYEFTDGRTECFDDNSVHNSSSTGSYGGRMDRNRTDQETVMTVHPCGKIVSTGQCTFRVTVSSD